MKKLTFLFLIVVCLLNFGCFARDIDLGIKSEITVYDQYLDKVKNELKKCDQNISFNKAARTLAEGQKFNYLLKDCYVPVSPNVVNKTKTGDCKDRALWILWKTRDKNMRFVIGKYHLNNQINHAWVLWKYKNNYYIIDATRGGEILLVKNIDKSFYEPLYSYGVDGSFIH